MDIAFRQVLNLFCVEPDVLVTRIGMLPRHDEVQGK